MYGVHFNWMEDVECGKCMEDVVNGCSMSLWRMLFMDGVCRCALSVAKLCNGTKPKGNVYDGHSTS